MPQRALAARAASQHQHELGLRAVPRGAAGGRPPRRMSHPVLADEHPLAAGAPRAPAGSLQHSAVKLWLPGRCPSRGG